MPPRSRQGLWALAVLDAAAAIWMFSAGDWLDGASRLTSVITLGGHHMVVLGLAATGFVILAVAATMTRGFTEFNEIHTILVAVAGVVSVVALAGALSVAALVVGVVLLTALLARAFLRR